MNNAFICDAIRTPIGRYGGVFKDVRADDLGAIPLRALMQRNPSVDWSAVGDVIYGCANQAGEDNRNVAHVGPVGRLARKLGRRDHQSSVRIRHGRCRHGGTRN